MPVNLSLQEWPEMLIYELMFADDTAFRAHNHQVAQEIITFLEICKGVWAEN